MYSKLDLKNDLIKMGLVGDEAVFIHSSMKSIGQTENRADGVIDVLMEYFNKGLLMLPTHTWAYMDSDNNLFDVVNQDSNVGILTNIFRSRPNVYRSYHPTHSIAAYGLNAKEYIKGDEFGLTPASPKGTMGRLRDIDAKIMLIGCNHGQNTFIHSIEESYNVPNRFYDNTIDFIIKDNDIIIDAKFYKHHTEGMPNLSLNYSKAEQLLKEKGIVTYHKFGDADVLLMDARKLYDFIGKMLEIDIHVFDERTELDYNRFKDIEI